MLKKKNRPLTSVPQHAQQDNANVLPQYQHPPQMLASPAGQPWLSSVPQSAAAVTSVQQAGVQSSGTASSDVAANTTNPNSASDWAEDAAGDGRRYYYNKTQGNFRLRVVEGEFTDSRIVVMLVENGTGKTTFIRMLAGLLKLDVVEGGSELMDQEVVNLSGGELQRVALCLCLGKPADIYLIDEPSAYLDSEQRIVAAKVKPEM
ncbi:hypothetical protein KIW84_042858 [Lathyrus oleraceus]|uniref:ABC transporter domain-containing protein n=1 Tax=Pisum sativum TaxID=3888 RepID=A0A9D4XC04_PEA|nr:hypothetical protein KIW84_042858 [Pisum sativum]